MVAREVSKSFFTHTVFPLCVNPATIHVKRCCEAVWATNHAFACLVNEPCLCMPELKEVLGEIHTYCKPTPLSPKSAIETLQGLNGFRLGHLNIASLTKQLEQLSIYLANTSLDMLCLNETRLDESVSDNVYLKGYDIIRKDRKRDGGGVALYYREHLNVKERKYLVSGDLEAICAEVIGSKRKPLIVVCIYRPLSSKAEWFNTFEILLQNIENEEKTSWY